MAIKKKNKKYDSIIFWMVIFTILIILWTIAGNKGQKVEKINFSEFLENVRLDNVKSVKVDELKINFTIKNQAITIEGEPKNYKTSKFITYMPKNFEVELINILKKHNIIIDIEKPSDGTWWNILFTWLPLILIFAIWIYFIRQMQGGGNKAFSFGKSKAKLFSEKDKKITFKDVAGVDEAKEELQEIIEFLKSPKKFQKLGGKIPKGVLLVGPPGTGKTLLAKAVAGEAGVPFLSISGSDFVELFVGVGASRVRDLFDQGKKLAPCLIFIDEIDAVGRHRGAGLGGGHDEREQTLNQLLVEMDGFDANEGIIVIAATNRPDILDPALLRPGRFDRRIVVPVPDVKGREAILEIHTRNIPIAKNVKLDVIARGTPGFSGADLANLVNEAALKAAKENRKQVIMNDLEYAKDKVMMGAERKSMIISEEEKKITAYHESGHALLAALIPDADPIHKVTIIPRGAALGVTQQLPVDDRYTLTKKYLLAQISVLLGGRIAEELFLNIKTTGAGNDIKRATALARKIVCEWGMSSLGPITFEEKDEMVFLGKEISSKREYSDDTAIKIDKEIHKIIEEAYERGKSILLENTTVLERIANLLLEKESISSEEIVKILKEEKGEDIAVNIYNIEKKPKPKTRKKRAVKTKPQKDA
jgi:cell division protease FtsH